MNILHNIHLNTKEIDILPNLFLNDTYRKLIKNGRTYASFTIEELDRIFNEIKTISEPILDPMSGYGGLMTYCSQRGISTYNLEINLPAYFWQILINPQNFDIFNKIIEELLVSIRKLPKTNFKPTASNDWFSKEGISTSIILHEHIFKNYVLKYSNNMELSIALILPFIKRFSTSISGDLTFLKKGGITVFNKWDQDFHNYLAILKKYKFSTNPQKTIHNIQHGDIRSFHFNRKFNLVITSPPYPNYRDYYKMFAPENYFLTKIGYRTNQESVIGTNVVKNRKTGQIICPSVKKFISKLDSYEGSKKAESDIKSYYLPYFKNYFFDLETTCHNIIRHLEPKSTCYLVVVDNATRNLVVPVSQVIQEYFKVYGFTSIILFVDEVFHFGTKNPHARGSKAKHKKYILKLWR